MAVVVTCALQRTAVGSVRVMPGTGWTLTKKRAKVILVISADNL